MEKIKVLYVLHEKNANGASKSFMDYILEMKKHIDVHVIIPYNNGTIVKWLEENEVRFTYIKYYKWINVNYKFKNIIFTSAIFILRILGYLSNHFACYKISKLCKEENVTHIHTNTSVVDVGAKVAQQLKLPHIWHIREFIDEDFNMHYLLGRKYTYNYIRCNTSKLIYISKAVEKKFNMYWQDVPSIQLYNAINEKYLIDKEKKDTDEKLKLLLAGRISKSKGQMVACEAVKILVENGQENVQLFIAGEGSKKQLNMYITQNKLENNIECVGKVEDMQTFRESMDIELMCSTCEALGRVTIEGMMAGNPVIGCRSGGTEELIDHGKTGYLFEVGNAEDLANYISILYNDKEKLQKMGANARCEVKEKFKQNNYVEKLIRVYKECQESNENDTVY